MLAGLWGCTLTSYTWDLVQHSLVLIIDCLDAEQGREATLTLTGVFGLHFDLGTYVTAASAYLDEPWTYVELTSIEASPLAVNGRSGWRITAELWESSLEVLCLHWHISSDTSLAAAC